MASVSSSSPRARFDWEAALAQDADLLRIDEAVQQTIARLPGQPPARADAGRGSRFEAPPVKAEAEAPQFINVRDYQSESSSDVDTREVNPMDELSDFEPGTPQREQDTQEQDQDGQQDVEMQVQGQHRTGCEVCGSSERERDIVLCDDCDAEFHVFCLRPPLAAVPEGQWLCPKCSAKDPQMAEQVKTEQAAETEPRETAETTESAQVATGDTTAEDNATSIPVGVFLWLSWGR
ncbi:unnamed protein product [Phytophthora lilii]|uniref:Unnamed protein product n=1 Tax=Phytophthora lilii TaxID=2077276 RepID=A0A9W6X3W3_9STRA|nr:unnamed protein product [Phytophthora lilii]